MPRGWTRGPQGQVRPVGAGECAVHVMKIAVGEIEERVEKPPLEEAGQPRQPERGGAARTFARARNVTKTWDDVGEGDEAPPPHPLYGPGLPPPGAKVKPGP